MFCQKCGKPIDNDASFCRYCGFKVSADNISRDGAWNDIFRGNTKGNIFNKIKTFKFNVDFFIKYSMLIMTIIIVASVLKGLLPQSDFDNLHIHSNTSLHEKYNPNNDNYIPKVDGYEFEDELENVNINDDDLDESTQDDVVLGSVIEKEKHIFIKHFIDYIFNLYSLEESIKSEEFQKNTILNIYDYYIEILKKIPDEQKKYNKKVMNLDISKAKLSKMNDKELKDIISMYTSDYLIYSNVRRGEPLYALDDREFDEYLDIVFGIGADYRFDSSLSSNGIIIPRKNFQFAMAFTNAKLADSNQNKDEAKIDYFDNVSLFLPCSKDSMDKWESSNLELFKSFKEYYVAKMGNIIIMSKNDNFMWLESIPPSNGSVCEIRITREQYRVTDDMLD